MAGLLSFSLVATLGIGTALVTAPAAQAAPISTTVTAAVTDHRGVESMTDLSAKGDAWNNCISYQTADTTTGYTSGSNKVSRYTASTFVGAGSESKSAHGRGDDKCQAADRVVLAGDNAQSAVGIAPAAIAAVNDGQVFNLARITHYNNPVNAEANFFAGNLKIKVSGFDGTPVLSFPWVQWETANSQDDCPDGKWKGDGNCQDQLKFTSQISDQVLKKDGLSYKMVLEGFIPSTSTTCPAAPKGNPVNDFWTNEESNTNACIYASLVQVRNVTVNKVTAGLNVPTNQAFAFTSSGTLDGSEWKGGSTSVRPTAVATPVQVFKKDLLRSDKVTIKETTTSDSRWAVTEMLCTEIGANGTAQALAGASYANGTITLDKVGAPTNLAKPDISCTFTNTFTAGALKISKVLNDPDSGFNGSANKNYVGTFDCTGGNKGSFSIRAGGSQTVSGIPVGSRCTVLETPTPSGDLKNGSFSWGDPTYSPSGTVTITASTAEKPFQEVVITNTVTQNKGTFTVKKVVKNQTDSSAGFTGGGARTFPVGYSCTLAGSVVASGTVNASTTAAVASPPIATGASCKLSETLASATGDFADGSYEWVGNTGAFAPSATLTIGASTAPVNVTLTNTYKRNFGQLKITKTVQAPTGAFTGGNTMAFKGSYNCGSGDLPYTVTINTPFTSVKNIPAGAVCTVKEDKPSTGLLNASYQWTDPTFAPATVTVPKDGTGTIAITNHVVQNTGNFSVQKKITGPNGYTGAATRQFSVDYKCTLANGPAINGNLLVTTQTIRTSPNIPAGYACVLSESALSSQTGDFADSSYEWVAPTAASFAPSNAVTIGTSTTVGVVLNNSYTRHFGSLNLKKLVAGSGYLGGTAENFTVNYDCGGSYKGTVKLAAGTAGKTVTDLPANSICTVSEVAPAGNLAAAYKWGTPSWDVTGSKVTIAKGATVSATVTNPTIPIFGTISVEKSITGGGVKSGATFDLTVTCPNYTKTFTLPVGQRATTEKIPVGTACTISESNQPTGVFVDDSYAWGAKPANQDVTIAAENQNVAVTVINTTVRVFGSLTVSKTLTDPDNVYKGPAFSGKWACTYNGADSGSGPWSVAAGGSTVASNSILLGSSCVVMENPLTAKPSTDTSYSWLAPVLAPSSGTVVLSAAHPNGAVAVANQIVRSTGSFTVTKAVSGPAAGFPTQSTFPFTWACTGIGWAGDNGTFSLANGGFWSATGKSIPQGAECTVTEGANPAANTSYTWDGVAFTAVSAAGSQNGRSFTFKIPATEPGSPMVPVNVTATNTISQKFATVNVAKTVGAGYDGVLKFLITLDCAGAGSYFADVLGGGNANLAVPLGSKCTVSEASRVGGLVDDSYAWDTATFTPSAFEVTQTATPITVVVHNPTKRVFGSLDVTKILSGVTGVVDPAKVYQGTWKCTYGTDAPVVGNWSTTAGVTSTPSAGILLGSECVVATEEPLGAPSADPSYVWAAPKYSAAVTVTADGPAHLSVTNEVKRNTGSIIVRKELSGATPGLKEGESFNINYSCTAAGVTGAMSGSLPIGVGVDVTLLDNVPFGWSCAITETAPTAGQLKDASYSWGTATVTPETVVLAQGNNPTKVIITNDIVRNLGSVKLAKVFTGPSGIVDTDKAYSGTFTCTYDNAVIKSGNWETKAGAPATELAADLPVTTSCEATENALGAPSLDPSYTWNAPVATVATVVTGDPAIITVTNTLTRNAGSLTVSKNVTGDASELAGYTGGEGKNFTVKYSCTVPGQPHIAALRGTVDVANGGTETLATGIPFGWSCAVMEATPSSGLLKDSSFAWGAEIITPATLTLTAGSPTAAITVQNPVTRVYGSVQVKKVLAGPDGAGAVRSDRDYTGTWTCTYPGAAPISGTWSAKAQAAFITVSDKVLLNSSCVVTEDPLAQPVQEDISYQWVSAVPTNDSVALGKSAQLVMTNTFVRETGAFTITKRVDGAGYTGEAKDQPFAVTYDCGVGFTGTLNLAKDGQGSVSGIPAGSSCQLSEVTPTGHLQAAYKWLDGTWSANASNGAITIDKAAPVDVILTNHTEKMFGHVSVAKALAGEGGVVDGMKFTMHVVCTDGYSTTFDVVAAQAPVPTSKVAVGSECTVTEVPATGGLVDDSFGWATPPASQKVTVTTENQTVPVVVTNTTERRFGSLSVEKKLVDPDRVYAGGNFAGTWVCTYRQGDTVVVKNGEWSVQAGAAAMVVSDGILLGSSCDVSENVLPSHPSADTSYLWSASYSTGGNVVLTTLNSNQSVTVTNTITRTVNVMGVVPVDPLPVTAIVHPAASGLASTGASTPWFLGAGSIILTGGLVLMLIARRRREDQIL